MSDIDVGNKTRGSSCLAEEERGVSENKSTEHRSGDRDNTDTGVDESLGDLTLEHFNIEDNVEHNAKTSSALSKNALSILRVLLPSLTEIDGLLEAVWDKQDMLSEVLDRVYSELNLFDELVTPPGVNPQLPPDTLASTQTAVTIQTAVLRLKESRTRVNNINTVLKRAKSRLDSISMLAQAKLLQQ